MLKMVRVRSILVAMVICVTVLLTACGDNGKGIINLLIHRQMKTNTKYTGDKKWKRKN